VRLRVLLARVLSVCSCLCRRKPPPRQLLASLPWRWTCLRRKRWRYAPTLCLL
jgi:hypothetical protein